MSILLTYERYTVQLSYSQPLSLCVSTYSASDDSPPRLLVLVAEATLSPISCSLVAASQSTQVPTPAMTSKTARAATTKGLCVRLKKTDKTMVTTSAVMGSSAEQPRRIQPAGRDMKRRQTSDVTSDPAERLD